MRRENRTLLAALSAARSEAAALAARADEERVLVEEQNAQLTTLYVSGARLHEAATCEEVVAAIQEIVVNLLGSEELAVFVVDDDRRALRLVGCSGVDRAALQEVPLGRGIIGRTAERGERYVAREGEAAAVASAPGEEELTACVPLRVGTKVTGAVAIFRLLPQKSALEPGDDELLSLLETSAASALYAAGLYARREHGEEATA